MYLNNSLRVWFLMWSYGKCGRPREVYHNVISFYTHSLHSSSTSLTFHSVPFGYKQTICNLLKTLNSNKTSVTLISYQNFEKIFLRGIESDLRYIILYKFWGSIMKYPSTVIQTVQTLRNTHTQTDRQTSSSFTYNHLLQTI